jgi:polysaccharide biosynthesis protein PslG
MLADVFRRFAAVALVAAALATGCAFRADPADKPDKRIEFSILEDYDKGADLADIARDFDLFKELGVTTWRGSFGWDDYEPTPGTYDFDWLHRFADLAASRGIALRPYIGYTPAWAAAGGTDQDVWNDPPKDLDAWFRFVRTLAAEMRRHRNLSSYEIYNEENVRQWWDGSPAAYNEVLNRAAEAVQAGNPDAEVLLGGMVFPDAEWTEHVCSDERNRRSIAVIPFHAYPETWTPADVVVENYLGPGFARFVSEADASCGPKPIWINEMGYATTPGVTETDQARWWVRAVATFAATPRIEHLGIYEIKDLRQDQPVIGDAPNYHLGLTHVDRRKKLAFSTVARLVSMLSGHRIAWRAPQVTASAATSLPEVYRHLFTRADGRQWLFLWTRQQRSVVDVQLSKADSRAAEFALDGTPVSDLAIVEGTLPRITLEPGAVRFFEIVR